MYFAHLYPTHEASSAFRKGTTVRFEGPTFRSRELAEKALRAEMRDVVEYDLPLVPVIVELDRQNRVVQRWTPDLR